MRKIHLTSILLLTTTACKTDPGFEYIPAKPVLSEGAVCRSFPLNLGSGDWFDDEAVKLRTTGILSRGDGPGLHSLCGREESKTRFVVEQALVFDSEYEKQTNKTRYHVCTGTISCSEERYHPDATVTIALTGHKACEEMSRTYSHKNKPEVAKKEPTTPCERYTACVCALSAAKKEASLAKLCQEAKGLLASATRDDSSCNTGLALMRETAATAYNIPLPEICK